jgi:hypothetical protein
VHSLRKGHSFELVVAKWLTKVTGVKWFRVPMSGAMHTAQGVTDNRYRGDTFCDSSDYNDLVVECKSYKDPVTLADINNAGSQLNSWIAQTQKEAGNHMWLLFFKSNHGATFLLVPTLDGLAYAADNTLKPIFTACRGVCSTKEWMVFQVL